MSSGYSICEVRKIKNTQGMLTCQKHNLDAEWRKEHVLNSNPALASMNEEIVKLSRNTYNEAFKEKISGLDYYKTKKLRKDAVRAIEVVLTFSKSAEGTFSMEDWKKESMKWLKDNFEIAPKEYGSNIISAVCHMDESVPHIHAVILPVDENGHLNAKRFTGGRMAMRAMKKSYGKAMEGFGLEPGEDMYHPKYEDIKKLYVKLDKALASIPEPLEGETASEYKERSLEDMKTFRAASVKDINERQWEAEHAAARTIKAAHDKAEAEAQRVVEQTQAENQALFDKLKASEKRLCDTEEKLRAASEKMLDRKDGPLAVSGLTPSEIYDLAEEQYEEQLALDWYRGVDEDASVGIQKDIEAVITKHLDAISRTATIADYSDDI